jgi:molybdopterin-guanine dinucleotide biosynthesis protein A
MKNSISGAILAGGTNNRFGGITKANVVIEGVTIISRIISVIEEFFPELIIVTNRPDEFQEFSQFNITKDQYLNAGPLAGIHAAMKVSAEEAVFIFAGDMPFPDKRIIADQIKEFNNRNCDVLIPKIGHYIEPLHAIYRKSLLNDLERFISERRNRAVRDFLGEVNVEYLQLSYNEQNRRAFTNINSPSDLDNIIFKYSLPD